MRFARGWLLAALAVFVLEVAIAAGLGGPLVRGSLGDVLVIVLIHCALRAVTRLPRSTACVLAVACGFLVEALQYLHLGDRLGLVRGSVASIVLGNTATVGDLVAYLLGGLAAWLGDRAADALHARRRCKARCGQRAG